MFKTRANICVMFTTEREGLPGTNAAMILFPGPYCVGDPHDSIKEEIPAKQCKTPLLTLNGFPKNSRLNIEQDPDSGDVTAKVFSPSGLCLLDWVFVRPEEYSEYRLYPRLLRQLP
jgi:hypothetical protein